MNRGGLRFACAPPYIPAMDREYWLRKLREAKAELEAARKRSEVNAAAAKLQRAKAELKVLEQKPKNAKRPANRASVPAGASS